MKKLIIAIILILISIPAHADSWTYESSTDDMTDAVTTSANSPTVSIKYSGITYVHINCRSNGKLDLTVESDETVATPTSIVTLTIRIDKNPPLELQSTMYNYTGSYTDRAANPEIFDSIVDQLKAGNKVLIYTTSSYKRGTTVATLHGSGAAIDKVYADCGVSVDNT